MKIKHFNRIKVKSPKRGRCWCPCCDKYLISDGSKCPVCKRRINTGRFKGTPSNTMDYQWLN